MGKEFKRLKRYNTTWTLLRTLAVVVSLALLIVGGMMLLSKVHIIEASALHYAIGAACAVAVGLVYWLLQRKNDLRIAEKIDAEHKLKERVQTMVEYRDGESAMLQVQREDTELRLKAVRKFGQKKLTLAAHFLLIVVAVVVFAVGIIMPVQAVVVPPEPTEPPFEASEWQKAALDDLIEHVRASDMLESVKDLTVAKLEEVRDALDTKLTANNVKQMVIEAIRYIYAVTDAANSNDDIHDSIMRIVEHSLAKSLAYALGTINNADREDQLSEIGQLITSEENMATLGELADMLDEVLNVSIFDETDPLYAAVANATAGLHQAADAMEAGDEDTAKNVLGTTMNDLKNQVGSALTQQDLTKKECVYVVDTLCEIFDISASERPGDPDEVYMLETDEDYKEAIGGVGTGEMQFAGKDNIYDYQTNTLRPYGEVINEYFALMTNKRQDGSLPPEILAYIESYFNELYSGSQTGDKGEN